MSYESEKLFRTVLREDERKQERNRSENLDVESKAISGLVFNPHATILRSLLVLPQNPVWGISGISGVILTR